MRASSRATPERPSRCAVRPSATIPGAKTPSRKTGPPTPNTAWPGATSLAGTSHAVQVRANVSRKKTSKARLLRALVQGHGLADESLQCLLVDLLALVEVDRTPRVPLEARVEQARRILQGRPLGERHLHDLLVRLAGADQPVVRPHRIVPLPLLDDVGIGGLDQPAKPAEHLAPPVAQILDPRVDQRRRGLAG